MLINESGLVRAIKSAYKRGGYTVDNQGAEVAIYTESWYVKCLRATLPRKVMAAIVEHTGMIPEEGVPVLIQKDMDPQLVMEDVARDETDHWRSGQHTDDVTMVPVIMQGYQIFQPQGGGECWGVPFMSLELIERDVAEHSSADIIDNSRLLWHGDSEAVVVAAVRKATSGWAKAWERAVWAAMESVDLHKEEA